MVMLPWKHLGTSALTRMMGSFISCARYLFVEYFLLNNYSFKNYVLIKKKIEIMHIQPYIFQGRNVQLKLLVMIFNGINEVQKRIG